MITKKSLNNGNFYTEFHNLVCKLKDYFEDNDIVIGSCDPAGMTHHEIALIAAWECYHKNWDLAKIIDEAKKNLEFASTEYKAEVYHVRT